MSTLRELIVSIDFDGIDLRKLLKLDSIMDEVEDTLGRMGAELRDVAGETRDLAREADHLGRELRNAGRDADRMGDSLNDVGRTGGNAFDSLIAGVKRFAAAAGVLYVVEKTITAIKDALTSGIRFNADMENSMASWETILGSAEKARDTIQDLQKLGADTPFEFGELDKAAKLLTMAKLGGDKLKDNLTAIGDAVSAIGGNGDVLEGVSMALFQMSAKGKVQAEEMMQLAERGIPAWDILAKKMGKTTAEVMDMASDGRLLAKDTLPLLVKGMEETFGGSMQKKAKTWDGMMSTLRDNWNMLMGAMSKPMFDQFKEIMPSILRFVNFLNYKYEKQGVWGILDAILPPGGADYVLGTYSRIKDFVSGALDFLSGIFEENGGHISRFFTNLSSMAESVFNFLGLLWSAWGSDITAIVSNALSTVLSVASGALQLISDVFNVFTSLLRGDWSGAMDGIKSLFSNMLGNLLTIGRELLALLNATFQLNMQDVLAYLNSIDLMQVGRDIINGLINGMSSMFDSAVNYVKQFGQDIKQALIDFFDIHSPSREMAWIGEQITAGVEVGISRRAESAIAAAENMGGGIYAGAAQIAPSGGTSGVGGGHTFAPNITIQINGVSGNAENIAQEAAAAARREFMRLWEELQVKFA
jgi:tape measure domain-containing protein